MGRSLDEKLKRPGALCLLNSIEQIPSWGFSFPLGMVRMMLCALLANHFTICGKKNQACMREPLFIVNKQITLLSNVTFYLHAKECKAIFTVCRHVYMIFAFCWKETLKQDLR